MLAHLLAFASFPSPTILVFLKHLAIQQHATYMPLSQRVKSGTSSSTLLDDVPQIASKPPVAGRFPSTFKNIIQQSAGSSGNHIALTLNALKAKVEHCKMFSENLL